MVLILLVNAVGKVVKVGYFMGFLVRGESV